MCELLALHFNEEIRPQFSLKGFKQRASTHRHGWGLAWFPDGEAQVVKEPRSAANSSLFDAFYQGTWLKGSTVLSHLRYATHGSQVQQNTHPFMRYYGGKSIVFAHNGVLRDHQALKLENYRPVGDTDSEHAFCFLLGAMKKKQLSFSRESDYAAIQSLLQEINRQGKFNCLFSDGVRLFAYHTNTSGASLYATIRHAPFGSISLADLSVSLNLADEKNTNTRGVVVATAPITDNENWSALPKGKLLVFEKGLCIFGNLANETGTNFQ